MYNMDITIPVINYKISLEILILIGIIYLIMVIHTICGCCNLKKVLKTVKESMENMTNVTTLIDDYKKNGVTSLNNLNETQLNDMMQHAKKSSDDGKPIMNDKQYEELKAYILKKNSIKEGFVGANTNYGQSTPYDITSSEPVNTYAWMQPNLTVVPGQPLDPAVQAILNRPEQPVPLPEGEMLMFANTPFKPECCPNTYSNSSGCACMTVGQYNGLVTRMGNNVPFSEY